jgi:tetratricopeptide (TPR) repeat protein
MKATGYLIIFLKRLFFLIFFISSLQPCFSQKTKADSLKKLLATEKIDTNRARLLWQLSSAMSSFKPDTAITISFEALSLARNLQYTEGESRATGIMANNFLRIGNYPRALELYIEKIKIEEGRNVPENLASALMNIGVVYALQEEYDKALLYYRRADSIIQKQNVEKLKYNIALNTGDAYDRLNISDSAFKYFNLSLEIAQQKGEDDFIGTSMTGIGHSYRKMKKYAESQANYSTGISYLKAANDDEVLCEATLGLAKLFEETKRYDSAEHYAIFSLSLAKADGFLSKELEAAEFLTQHYKQQRNIDSAFTYVNYVEGLNDSVNSKSKIRESQVISSNEQFRQLELEEERSKAKKKRFQQLQMLLIGIFIPGFFLLTLMLSRVNISIKIIRLLGVLSLLFLFEYLTLLLHPTVAALTHHTPVLEILIFVALAALLIPAHHKLEHWMIHKLLNNHTHHKPAAVDKK